MSWQVVWPDTGYVSPVRFVTKRGAISHGNAVGRRFYGQFYIRRYRKDLPPAKRIYFSGRIDP